MIKALLSFILFTILLGLLSIVFHHYFGELFATNYVYLFLFHCITSFAVLVLFFLGLQKAQTLSLIYTFGGMVVKTILNMFFIVILVYVTKPESVKFITNFFFLYLSFTIFEISILLRTLRRENKS